LRMSFWWHMVRSHIVGRALHASDIAACTEAAHDHSASHASTARAAEPADGAWLLIPSVSTRCRPSATQAGGPFQFC
jgi:hypothetical protein